MSTQQRHTFHFPTSIRFGCGVIDELPDYLQRRGIHRPQLVTDGNIAQLDFFQAVSHSLKQAGLTISVFSDMRKNPVKSDIIAGGAHYVTNHCDAIIGIGGGVPLDVARAIALRIYHKRDLFDYDDLIGGDKYVTEEVPPFICVPTTAGTGSEVGRSAIIGDDASKKKRILFSPKLLAEKVFADPELTMGLPAFVTAATGMDALTHNIEAYLAKNYHPMCDGIALEGMKLVTGAIEMATHNPTLQARSDMLLGSMMGAIAFQKGLGVVHSLAHPLSTLLDTHHGLANAVNLPYGMEFNYSGFEDRFDQMAKNIGAKDGKAIPDFLFGLNDRLGIPNTLGALDVKEEHIEPLSELAVADFCHPNNPKPVTKEDFRSLYRKAL